MSFMPVTGLHPGDVILDRQTNEHLEVVSVKRNGDLTVTVILRCEDGTEKRTRPRVHQHALLCGWDPEGTK